ncbi:dolichyl-P-Glc:Glc2Man9GlcNAc2-PP-dolichol alpha-1,2-glucosyltransferase [Malassezia cuniculi]|uniref:Dol-P-Glc:Glc(2)Man(9)GlcNAc(2)-PP-Dol alpha-1,2-glucosyltransferase n=1 Tax=Malassezia cuniculi TaxID=948313 RepID=A0AAF0EZ75_9BASI|nr:dolichyl-P-Glc:Glc2Man9GlcNAc2-PP-dolichol alpha-1,2-glucosyltransferase [Malassezia cuniculi]
MQRYAANDRYWDPKITTPPGLYYLTIGIGRLIDPLVGAEAAYSVGAARATNLLGLAVLVFVLQFQQPKPSIAKIAALAALPPLWFFGFLYYTDVWSVVLVLGALAFAQHRRHFLAALVGALSLFFRQNNVVWVLFVCGTAVLAELEAYAASQNTSRDEAIWLAVKPACLSRLVAVALPYSLPLLGFAAFLKINGGIVLGDKENHAVLLHIPQLGYFFAFAAIFSWPTFCALALRTRVTPKRVAMFFGLAAIGLLGVKCCTVVHPFMLADNRHYVFYVWRRIINVHPYARYALVPFYVASLIVFCSAIH